MPARKKQATDEVAPPASRRTKSATTRKSSKAKETTPRSVTKSPAAGSRTGGKRTQDLVIVESPAKAKTINKYLGANFKVLASYGHVRDLPRRRKPGEKVAGINIEGGWLPTYVVVDRAESGGKGASRRRTAKEILAELKREAAKSNHIYLATDPDREGEAIAWHIEDALGLDEDPRVFRITFNEITRSAVQRAIAQPGKIDMDRVHAQEARRILDRVVGFPLSGLLSKKVAKRSSAGRVQSVALRLVVDREREIEAFVPSEYWKIVALLAPQADELLMEPKPLSLVLAKTKGESGEPAANAAGSPDAQHPAANAAGSPKTPPGTFLAELSQWDGEKFAAANEETATTIARWLDQADYRVAKLEQKDRAEKPQAPFTTSSLQQTAFLRLRFTGDRTMKTAQRLYEGVDLGGEGSVALITYMRTDSTRVSAEALQAVRGHIEGKYGSNYLPANPNTYASGKSAQEAHEAIRPTDLSYTPERLSQLGLHGDQLKLYTLIYQRFVASQMSAAVFAVTNVEIRAEGRAPSSDREHSALLKAQGKVLKFDGYRKVMPPTGKQEDATLPALSEQQKLDRLDLTASQHFTQPPPRFNEASLVKALEKEGIGRPSTYATIIHKITSPERAYIEVKDRRFYATKIGKDVTDLLIEHFPRVMDLKFTSQMEEELDQIETKQARYNEVLNEFWGPFSEALKTAEEKMPSQRGAETGEMCPQCGKPLVRNYSKKTHRYFIGCSGFKEGCKFIKPEEGEEARPQPVETEYTCPTCGKTMLERMGKTGPFLGCSGYPECKTTMNFGPDGKPVLSAVPTEHTCEKCGQPMVIRQGRRGPFLACTGYPKCKNAKDVDAQGNPVKPIDTGIACEKCGSPMAVKKGFRGPFLGCSNYPKCRSTKPIPAEMKDKLKELLPAPAPKKTMPEVKIEETCPECGGAMKLRSARKGYFLGCAKYPKCKGTREASPELLEKIQENAEM